MINCTKISARELERGALAEVPNEIPLQFLFHRRAKLTARKLRFIAGSRQLHAVLRSDSRDEKLRVAKDYRASARSRGRNR